MAYQKLIAKLAGSSRIDPRHIEAVMRVAHGTLDHLSREEFEKEVIICSIVCAVLEGDDRIEKIAQTYGL